MKALVIGIVLASLMIGGVAALSVSQPAIQHITSVGVAHPQRTLQVQQAGLYSKSSVDSTNILQ